MEFELSIHAKDVMVSRCILEEWIRSTIENPSAQIKIDEYEIHYFGTIHEYGDRCLKVVVNPIKYLIITAYFDRKKKRKGCR